MARSCSSCCVTNSYAKTGDITAAYGSMGYVGFVKLRSPTLTDILSKTGQDPITDQTLRVSSFDVGLSQAVDRPEVIDGRIDKTAYKLQPFEVEGTMDMPVIAETFKRDTCPQRDSLSGDTSAAGRMIQLLWCWTTSRDPVGRMGYDDVSMDVRYANQAAFTYSNCLVNEFTLTATQGDQLGLSVNVFGRARSTNLATQGLEPTISDYLSPARILTWNDVSITGLGGCSSSLYNDYSPTDPMEALFFSNTIRSWELRISNNLERFYTFNGSLYPADINAGVREVGGSFEFMGLNDNLRDHTIHNQDHFTEKNEVRFAFYVGDDQFNVETGQMTNNREWTDLSGIPPTDSIFARRLRAVIFEIEEMSLSNDLFTTSCNYHALAIDDDGLYEFVDPATSAFPVWSDDF